MGKDFRLAPVARVELKADGSLGMFDNKQKPLGTVGTFGGGAKKNNLMLAVSCAGALQVVSGDQILWASDGNVAPSIEVGLVRAGITRVDSELKSEPGWDQCWVLKDPAIKIIATNKVSKDAINAVAVTCDEMTKRLQPGLDPKGNPRGRFNGFKVYLTNEEYGPALKQLSGVKTFWHDGTDENSRDFLLGGARPTDLWISEQMICKTGVKTRAYIGKPDKTTRTFDRVVHEFAHSIDMTFGLQQKNNNSEIFKDGSFGRIGSVEGFAWAVRLWYGTPGGTLTGDQNARLSGIIKSRVSFSAEGYAK